jgi:hypothetical protein
MESASAVLLKLFITCDVIVAPAVLGPVADVIILVAENVRDVLARVQVLGLDKNLLIGGRHKCL